MDTLGTPSSRVRVGGLRDRIETLSWIWKELMNEYGRRKSRLLMVIILASAAIVIFQPYGIGVVFRGLGERNVELLLQGVLILIGFMFLENGTGWMRQFVREQVFNVNFWHIPMCLTRAYFRRTLGMHLAEDSEIDGGGVESTRDKIWTIQDHVLFTMLPGYSCAVLAIIACLWIGPYFGLLALLYCGMDWFFSYEQNNLIHRKMRPIAREIRRWDRRVRNRWADVSTVKYNGVEARVENDLTKEIQPTLRRDFSIWAYWFPRQLFSQKVVGGIVRIAIIGYAIHETYFGVLTIEKTTLLIFSLERISLELMEISNSRRVIQENMIRVHAYRDALTKEVSFEYAHGVPFVPQSAGVSIELRSVSLAHTMKGNSVRILRNVQATIAQGERVAIVGPSGAGKSQLTNLILRAFDPLEGKVLIDGRDIREFALESFCAVVGHIPQGAEVFEGTIRENVCFGLSERKQLLVTDEDVWVAIRKAGLDFEGRLFDGLDTNIGFRGMRLSGGERQRLTIARAHIKEPRLVIADEATSALDSLSEAHVLDELYGSLEVGTTAIMIAHRLSSLARCTKILFVRPLCLCSEHEEQVRTYASMQELYETDPLFRRMADQQGFAL